MELFKLTASIILNAKGVLGTLTKLNNQSHALEGNFNKLIAPTEAVTKSLKKFNPTETQATNTTNFAKSIRELAGAYRELAAAQQGVQPIKAPSAASVKATVKSIRTAMAVPTGHDLATEKSIERNAKKVAKQAYQRDLKAEKEHLADMRNRGVDMKSQTRKLQSIEHNKQVDAAKAQRETQKLAQNSWVDAERQKRDTQKLEREKQLSKTRRLNKKGPSLQERLAASRARYDAGQRGWADTGQLREDRLNPPAQRAKQAREAAAKSAFKSEWDAAISENRKARDFARSQDMSGTRPGKDYLNSIANASKKPAPSPTIKQAAQSVVKAIRTDFDKEFDRLSRLDDRDSMHHRDPRSKALHNMAKAAKKGPASTVAKVSEAAEWDSAAARLREKEANARIRGAKQAVKMAEANISRLDKMTSDGHVPFMSKEQQRTVQKALERRKKKLGKDLDYALKEEAKLEKAQTAYQKAQETAKQKQLASINRQHRQAQKLSGMLDKARAQEHKQFLKEQATYLKQQPKQGMAQRMLSSFVQARHQTPDQQKFGSVAGVRPGPVPPPPPLAPWNSFSGVVKNLANGFSGATSKSAGLLANSKMLNKQFHSGGRVLNAFTGTLKRMGQMAGAVVFYDMFRGFQQGIRNAINVSTEFQAALRDMNGLAGLTEEKLAKASDHLRTSASRLGIGVKAAEMTQGIRSAMAAGYEDYDEAAIVADQGARLAKAGGLADTQKGIELLGSALKAWGEGADKAEYYAEVLITSTDQGLVTMEQLAQSFGRAAPLAAASGVGVEELMAAIGTGTAKGVRTETAVTGLGQAISKLTAPSKAGKALLDDLGITINKASIESKTFAGTIREIMEAIDYDPGKAKTIFGTQRGTNAIFSLADETGEGFSTFEKNIENVSIPGMVDKRIGEINKSLAEQWKIAAAQMESAFIWLGKELDPILAGFLKSLSDIQPDLNELFKTLKLVITDFISVFTDSNSSGLRTAINFITLSFKSLYQATGILALAFEETVSFLQRLRDPAKVAREGEARNKARKEAEKDKSTVENIIKATKSDYQKDMKEIDSRENSTFFLDNKEMAKKRETVKAEFNNEMKRLLEWSAELDKKIEDNTVLSLQDKIFKFLDQTDKSFASVAASKDVPFVQAEGNDGIWETKKQFNKDKHLERMKEDKAYADNFRKQQKFSQNFENIALESQAAEYSRQMKDGTFDPKKEGAKALQDAYTRVNRRKSEEKELIANKSDELDENLTTLKQQISIGEISPQAALKTLKDMLAVAQEHKVIESTQYDIKKQIFTLEKKMATEKQKALKQAEAEKKKELRLQAELASGTQSPQAAAMTKLDFKKQDMLEAKGADPEQVEAWYYAQAAKIKDKFAKEDEKKAREKEVRELRTAAELAEVENRTLDAKLLALDAEFKSFERHEQNKVQLARLYAAKRAKIERDHANNLEADRIQLNSKTVENEVQTLKENGNIEVAKRMEYQQTADERYLAIKQQVEFMRERQMSEVDITRYVESEKIRILRDAKKTQKAIEDGTDLDDGYSADPRLMDGKEAFSGVGFSGIGGSRSKLKQREVVDPAAISAAIGLHGRVDGLGRPSETVLDPNHQMLKDIMKSADEERKPIEDTITVIVREKTADGRILIRSENKRGERGSEWGQEATYERGRGG